MKKDKTNIIIETDVQGANLEEIADIPEKTSRDILIDGDVADTGKREMDIDLSNAEEISGIDVSFTEPVIISDDYMGKTVSGKYKLGVNVASLAAEIDKYIKVNTVKKRDDNIRTRPVESVLKESIIEKAKDQESINEIIIKEEDDIDLDYYSSEDIGIKEDKSINKYLQWRDNIVHAGKNDIKNSIDSIDINEIDFIKDMEDVKDVKLVKDIKDIKDVEAAKTVKDSNILTIEVPEEFKDKLPDGFDLQKIDLKEAEEIANEDLVLLRESDLIKELEELDIAPVKKTGPEQKEKVKIRREEETDKKNKSITRELTSESKKDETKTAEKNKDKDIDKKDINVKDASSQDIKAKYKIEEKKDTLNKEIEIKKDVKVPEKNKSLKDEKSKDSKIIEKQINPTAAPVSPKKQALISRQGIPEDLISRDLKRDSVQFIDDELVDKASVSEDSIFRVGDLEKITSEIADVIEGKPKLLSEADASEDMDKVARIMKGTAPAFEDLLIDLEGEYAFKDDDIGFIDNAFIRKDQNNNAESIHDVSTSIGPERMTRAVELLGLNMNEIESVESNIFSEKLKNENLNNFNFPKAGSDQSETDVNILKKYNYLMPNADSLLDNEKKSIEEDITAENALIYEEDIEEIKSKLQNILRRKAAPVTEKVSDISDKVVIIEDADDVERFMNSLPDSKKEVLKKLFKYMDNLFEKLPEDVIRNFADSEYYELYSKVLNDLDV